MASLLTAIITAIITALLATIIILLMLVAARKCRPHSTPGGAARRASTLAGEGEGPVYERITNVGEGGVVTGDYNYVGTEAGNTFKLKQNKAYALRK